MGMYVLAAVCKEVNCYANILCWRYHVTHLTHLTCNKGIYVIDNVNNCNKIDQQWNIVVHCGP